jgi:hypothetical protein
MSRYKGIFGKLLLVSVVALSLAVSAFAHRAVPPSGANQTVSGLDIEAFRLPDGSLPSFCLNTENEDGSSGTGQETCDFCTLSHGIGVPAATALPLRAKLNDCAIQAIRERIASRGIFSPGTPSTGPPVFS